MGVPGTRMSHWNSDVRSSVLNGPLLGFDFDVKQTLRSRNVMIVAVSALAFGVGASLVKGNNAGIRDLVGNVFAPWLLVSFLGGAIAVQWRVVLGAVAGTASFLIALLGFYVTDSLNPSAVTLLKPRSAPLVPELLDAVLMKRSMKRKLKMCRHERLRA